MILGISTDAFLTFHVIISLIGIASGLVVLYGLVNGQALGAWTAVFSRNHDPDQRHRLSVAAVRLRPAARYRDFIPRIARSRRCCFLRVSPRRSVALGLRSSPP